MLNYDDLGPVFVLDALVIIVVVLTILFIIGPLFHTSRKVALSGTLPLFVFFSAIGFGVLLVEISQMQRLVIFLGHPAYALSVVLFALLLSSGLGSYLTHCINSPGRATLGIVAVLLLVSVLAILGVITPYAIDEFQGSVTTLRILIAVVMLFPIGIFMGMAFPLGMNIASARSRSITSWLWGINGATSVCVSVLAVAIALSSSISTAFWIGVGFYAVAIIAFVWATRRAA